MKRGRRLRWLVVGLAACALTRQSPAGAQVPGVASPVAPVPSASATGPGAPLLTSPATAGLPGAVPPAPLADSLQGQAKADYEAARLLYDSGDYAGALLKFQSAYRATGDPRLLWNAAGCARNLHNYAKAMLFVRQFLASQSALVTPEFAARGQAFLDAAEPLTAPLEIESNQPSSSVFLDDELLGTPAQASQSRVDLGTHRLVVQARGYQPYNETLTVLSSTTLHVTATLHALVVPLPVRPARPHQDHPNHGARASLLPTWVWITGASVVLAGIATASYFIFKPSAASGPLPGSIATLRF
ncbi:MAG: PEGA domain-containing protein [Pseudomonadota bacterium]